MTAFNALAGNFDLTYTTDCNGELGLIFNDAEIDLIDAASSGGLVAHDLLEHINGLEAIGTVQDELQALGAALYTRVETCTGLVTVDGLVNDVIGLLERFAHKDMDGDLLETLPACKGQKLDLIDVDYMLQRVREKLSYDELENLGFDLDYVDTWFSIAYDLICYGYEIQSQRYPVQYRAGELFENIENAIDKAMLWLEIEGEQITLRIAGTSATVIHQDLTEGY